MATSDLEKGKKYSSNYLRINRSRLTCIKICVVININILFQLLRIQLFCLPHHSCCHKYEFVSLLKKLVTNFFPRCINEKNKYYF